MNIKIKLITVIALGIISSIHAQNQTVNGILTVKDKIKNHSSGTSSSIIEGFVIPPTGYVSEGLNFRFDTSQTGYLEDKYGATISVVEGTSPGQEKIEGLFTYQNKYINLDTFKSSSGNFEIMATGFDLNNSSNNHWKPYILFHAGAINVNTVVVSLQDGSGLWTEVYRGTSEDIFCPKDYYRLPPAGRLLGVKFRFEGITDRSFLKMVGASSRTSSSYAWSMLKSGGEFYGDISGKNGILNKTEEVGSTKH